MAKPVFQRTVLWHMGLLILALAADSLGSPTSTTPTSIEVDNGGPWGVWYGVKMCPRDFYAYGFSLRVEKFQRNGGDDTALNGMRLMCKHKTYPIDDVVVEYPGLWGDWTAKQSCSSGYLESFQLRVESSQGRRDDTAANNINFHCSNGDILQGDGMSWGHWGRWSPKCPKGVCGMQMKYEGRQRGGDDTALNDIKLMCC